MSNLIAQAVEPLKQKSIEAAIEATTNAINATKKKLEAANWDLDVAFPRANGFQSRKNYLAQSAAVNFASSLVKSVKPYRMRNEPNLVVWANDKVAIVFEQAAEMAAQQYEAYVAKLVAKVGDCDAAHMAYVNGVWFDSDLVVTKGEVKEVWNTKCIVNQSCLGKVFNQFPTRKRK